MDSVRLRLERDQPLSFLEFNYMVLQSYDFVELARRHGCELQMGGSDQWGNIVTGVELGRRVGDVEPVRPDDAADHDRVRRQDGQDRAGRRLAQRRPACRPTTTGSSGATPRTPMSAASCACSPICRWTRSRGWSGWPAPRSTRRRRSWPSRRRALPRRRSRGGGGRDGARVPSRKAGPAAISPRSTCRGATSSAAFPLSAARADRPRVEQRRGAPADQAGRRAPERCRRHRHGRNRQRRGCRQRSHQTVRRQEAARPGPRGLAYCDWLGACCGPAPAGLVPPAPNRLRRKPGAIVDSGLIDTRGSARGPSTR